MTQKEGIDDQVVVAAYAVQEVQRISEVLDEWAKRGTPPSPEEQNRVIQEIENALARIKSALSHIELAGSDDKAS